MGGEVVLKVLFGAKQNNSEFAVAVADLITTPLWVLGMIFFIPYGLFVRGVIITTK